MAIEQGIVKRLNDGVNPPTAWIEIVRTGACESCSSRDSCHVGKGGPTEEVEAVNSIKARMGDRIQVAMETGALMKATFLLYLFPILCMIVGGIAGSWLSIILGIQGSIVSVVSALAFLVVSMIIVRVKGRRMGMKRDYQPRILRIIGRDPNFTEGPQSGRSADSQQPPP